MILSTLSFILFLIFIILGGFHFYWLFGGIWGLQKVIPTKSEMENFRPPPRFATLIVAILLSLFGLIYLVESELIDFEMPIWVSNYGHWVIPTIFILRAIGEFNYVGLFKKIKHTEFAKADTKIFSPLCLTIGTIGLLIQLLK